MSDSWDNPSAYEGQVTSGFSEEARELFAQAEFPAKPTPNPQETVGGYRIHSKADCTPPCPFHAPSDHPLKDAPIHIRGDKMYLVERTCKHGVGHDDPDSVAYLQAHGQKWAGVHGCDGCCGESIRETSTNTQSPELAEPHVAQAPPVPQESSPGEFEEVVANILDEPMDELNMDEMIDGMTPYLVKRISAAHNRAIQAAKREADLKGSIEAAMQIYGVYRAHQVGGEKMFDFDKWLPEQIKDWKTELKHLEEETTS